MIKKYNQFNEGIKHLLVGPTIDEMISNIGIDRALIKSQNDMNLLFHLYKKFKDDKVIGEKINSMIKNLSDSNLVRLYDLGYDISSQDINSKIINLCMSSFTLRKKVIDVFYNEIQLDDDNIILLKKLLSECVINGEFDNIQKIFEIDDFRNMDLGRILINAIRRNNYDIIKFLLDKKINFNVSDFDCYLHALLYDNYKVIKLLVDYGFKVDNNVIKQAVLSFKTDTQDDYEILDLLIKNNTEEKDNSILPQIIWNWDCLKILLENGYDATFNNNICLFRGVEGDYYDSCKLLLKYGASPNIRRGELITYPIKKDDIKMVKLLMDYNIEIQHPYLLLGISKSDKMRKLIKDYTNYDEKTNEGIKHLLVGPTEEEVWKLVGGTFYFETPPKDKKEFLDKLFENTSKIVTVGGIGYLYKDTFFVYYHMGNKFPLSIDNRITLIMGKFYGEDNIKELKWFYDDYFNNKFKELGDKDKYKMYIEISDSRIYDIFRQNNII